MLIRTEAPADILVVDQLLKNVFATEAEADLVMALRENGQRTFCHWWLAMMKVRLLGM